MSERRRPWGLLRESALLCLALSLSSCDRPPAPASTPSPSPRPSGPPPGLLRLTPGPLPPEITREPAYRDTLPSLCLRVEYTGPKEGIRVETEAFEHGRSRSSSKSVRAIDLPLSGEVAFALGESKNSEGVLLAAVLFRFVTTPSPGSRAGYRNDGGVSQTPTAPIGTRPTTQVQPTWPLEIADGQEVIIWGVFVGEPEGAPAGGSPAERAKRAEAAWIFKISMAEKPKKEE